MQKHDILLDNLIILSKRLLSCFTINQILSFKPSADYNHYPAWDQQILLIYFPPCFNIRFSL